MEDYEKKYYEHELQQVKQSLLDVLKEMAPYRHLEEELGIDLTLLPKILKAQYIFVKEYKSYGKLYFTIREGKVWFDIPYPVDIHGWVEFSDYGRTWALTKKELK